MRLFSFLLLLLMIFSFSAVAQKDSTSRNYLVIDASYAYLPNPKVFPQQTLMNQRFGYLQVAYLAKLSARTSVGIHFAWEESSFDRLETVVSSSSLFLERNQQIELGLIYRAHKAFVSNKLFIFFQANSDLVFANKRGQQNGIIFKEEGTGFKLQMRPGLQYAIGRNAAIEAGYGLIDSRFMVWSPEGSSGSEAQSNDFNVSMTFNLSSVFVGIKLAF